MVFRFANTLLFCSTALLLAPVPGWGEPRKDKSDVEQRLKRQEERTLAQQDELAQLRAQLKAIRTSHDQDLDLVRAGQAAVVPAGQTPAAALPATPVGERPKDDPGVQIVTALPEGMNVLSRPGSFIFTPSVEYTRSASNRLVFRGVEIVPGIQLGLVDANTVASDSTAGAADLRVGLFDRVEVEARVPYYYRHNALTTVSQQVTTSTAPVTQTQNLEGFGLGDIEFLGRYQINKPTASDDPFYIASVRLKTPTGVGPFDVPFDTAGIAKALPTGTGFWGAGGGLAVILPSDPAVLFASLGYLHNFSDNINKTIGSTPVGEVSPGDSLDGALGFGLALNPRFSFSLGYSHSMIFPSTTMLGNTTQRSNTLQAGRLTMGWSYQFNDKFTLNNNFEFGVTSDAPNLLITVRVPIAL